MKDKKFYLDETKAWKVSMRILKYLTLIAIVLGIYTYYPHSDVRNLEAEKYFMIELNKAMKDRDVLETDLTDFTKVPWNRVCLWYSYNGAFELGFMKDRYLRDTINILDLSEYISIKTSEWYAPNHNHPDNLASTCSPRGRRKFVIEKLSKKNRYIFKIKKLNIYKIENKKE